MTDDRFLRVLCICAFACGIATRAAALPSDMLKFDYADALSKSLLFYEAQRSGAHHARYTWRVPWRQPAALNDGSDVGVDLSGGWFDAGDTVKFGLPMSYSAAMLAWSVDEFPAAYQTSGELAYARDNLRFVLDYFLQAYRPNGAGEADDVFYYQVGDGDLDHAFWGPPEAMTMPRPAFACTATAPCSEVTAGTAAALAAGSMVFASADPAYAALLLDRARLLYAFADRYRSSAGYIKAGGFYTSYSGYWDELAWGAAWIHRASGDTSYLPRATAALAQAQDSTYWAHTWDNKSIGANLLLARATGAAQYTQKVDAHLEHWMSALPRTAGGLVFLDRWGSLRYASTTAFIALAHSAAVADPAKRDRYQRFALQQMNYILGDNPRASSYVCGFGVNPPRNPHHRAAHDSPTFNIENPVENRHELTGALVGGPASANDFDYVDDRRDFVRNEVAIDYNAAYTGALAAIVAMAGGYVPPTAPPTAVRSSTPTATRTPTLPPAGGVTTRLVPQSDWSAGYCADVVVSNGSAQPIDWTVTVAVDGVVTQTWNATIVSSAPGQLTAGGVSWNDVVPAGGSVSFGFCAARGAGATPSPTGAVPASPTRTLPPATATPVPPTAIPATATRTPTRPPATATRPPATATRTGTSAAATPTRTPTGAIGSGATAQVSIVDDWGSGYCANVVVSTASTAPVDWRVTFTIAGQLRELWNAAHSVSGSQVTAEGLSWNNLVTASQPVTFGFCANR